jgi:hypothetical protein
MPPGGGDHGLEGGIAQGLVEGILDPGGMPDTPDDFGNRFPPDTQPIRQFLVGDPPQAELIIDPQAFSGLDADPDDFPVASGQFLCHTVTILSPLTGGVFVLPAAVSAGFFGWGKSPYVPILYYQYFITICQVNFLKNEYFCGYCRKTERI